MRNFYGISTGVFSSVKGYDLLYDDGEKIYGIEVKYELNDIYRKHYLEIKSEHCVSNKNKNLADYFFENSSYYKRGNPFREEIIKLDLVPGKYYPRIYRPLIYKERFSTRVSIINVLNIVNSVDKYNYLPNNEKTLIQSIQQLSTLNDRLTSIFNNIYPTGDNLKSYGHEIRNLLILACTEVEAQCKGILIANNYKTDPNYKYSTNDYVKLNDILQLSKYEIKLSYFPDATNISPFKNWDKTKPSESLEWYDNYNAVKHNREIEFHKANLASTINAVSAIAILLFAQYGTNILHWQELIGSFFSITEAPDWDFNDSYLPPFFDEEWVEEKYKF